MIVMIAPIQIRNPDVVNDIRTLAAMTGRSITEAVADSVRARLAEVRPVKRISKDEFMRNVHDIQARIQALPKLGPPLTEADLYDEDGLPK